MYVSRDIKYFFSFSLTNTTDLKKCFDVNYIYPLYGGVHIINYGLYLFYNSCTIQSVNNYIRMRYHKTSGLS